MGDAPGRDWRLAGCTALLAALIAFPLGMMFAGGQSPREGRAASDRDSPPTQSRRARDFYSPKILDDPYVLQQQLRVVEALERSCRYAGEHCQEARQARERVKQPRSGE